MANKRLTLSARLEGSTPFLEIQSVDSNLNFNSSSQLKLADSISITDLTASGNLNIGGNSVITGELTADKINIDEFIFTDNQTSGLSFKSQDDTEYMVFQSTNGGEQIQIKKDVFFSSSNALIMGTNPAKGNVQYANITNSVMSEANNEIVLLNYKDNQTSAVNGGAVILGANGGFFFGYNQNLDNKPSGSDADSNDLGSFYVKKSTNGTTSFFRGEVGTMAVSKLHLGELASAQASSGENSAILSHENFLGGGTNNIEITETGHIYFTTPSSKNVVFKSGIGDPLVKLGNVSTDDSTFNYILNAPRPNSSSGGAVIFINGSSRSSDGGGSAMTLRNDSGKLRLGNSSYDTDILGNDITIATSSNGNLDIDTDGTGSITMNTTNNDILISASKTGVGNTASLTIQGDDELLIAKRADKYINIQKGTTSTGDSDRNFALFLGSTSANTTTGSSIIQNGATCTIGGGNALNITNNVSGGAINITTTSSTITLDKNQDSIIHCGRTILNGIFSDVASFAHEDNNSSAKFALLQDGTHTMINAEASKPIRFRIGGTGTSDLFTITTDGGGGDVRLGVADSTPDYGALDLHGTPTNINFDDSTSHTFWQSTNTSLRQITSGQNNEPILMVCNDGAWFRGNIFCTSDSRIKTDISDCDISDCLTKVNQIELKEYFYKDPKHLSLDKSRGFIAQQVKQIYPRAVNIIKASVPDILEKIENIDWIDNNDGTYSFLYDLTLEDNHTGKCTFYCGDTENDEKIIKIYYDTENRKFTFNKKWNFVFLYGRWINDLHTIDKNKLFQLYHGSIQELTRENNELRQEVETLRTQVNNNNTNLINLMARVSALEN